MLNRCRICCPYYVKGHLNTPLNAPALDFRWMCFTILIINSLCPRLLSEKLVGWGVYTHSHTYARTHICMLVCVCIFIFCKTQNFLICTYLASPTEAVRSLYVTMPARPAHILAGYTAPYTEWVLM